MDKQSRDIALFNTYVSGLTLIVLYFIGIVPINDISGLYRVSALHLAIVLILSIIAGLVLGCAERLKYYLGW